MKSKGWQLLFTKSKSFDPQSFQKKAGFPAFFIFGEKMAAVVSSHLVEGSGGLLCSRRIYSGNDFGNPVRRESTLLSVISYHLFARRDVHTVDFIPGHIALQPLDLGPHFV